MLEERSCEHRQLSMVTALYIRSQTKALNVEERSLWASSTTFEVSQELSLCLGNLKTSLFGLSPL